MLLVKKLFVCEVSQIKQVNSKHNSTAVLKDSNYRDDEITLIPGFVGRSLLQIDRQRVE